MKFLAHNVIIDRDKMNKLPKTVWDWELPILQERFPGGLVVVHGSTEVERESLPEVNAEYNRLRMSHSVEPDTKVPYCDLVYGRGAKGVKTLTKAIENSVIKEVAPKPPVKKKTTAKKPTVK